MVAPLAGAWIEIFYKRPFYVITCVAPLAGAWIEMKWPLLLPPYLQVAPLAGAWIEICAAYASRETYSSLPSRERGLK